MKDGYGFNPKNLELLVKDSKRSCAQIENESGIPSHSLSRYLHGNLEPSISSVVLLADYFRVPTDFIIGRIEMDRSESGWHAKEMGIGEKLTLMSAVEAMKYRRDKIIIELGKMLERANEICDLLDEN